MYSWVLGVALALSAPAPAAPSDPVVQPPAQVLALPPVLQDEFRRKVLAGRPGQMQKLERLVHFVFDADALGMTYQDDATNTVAESYATRKANCMGFTLLFLALAREAGLDAYPQEVGETLTWREVGGTIYRNDHINAGVLVATDRYTLDVAGDLVFSLHPPVRVSDDRLLAHYYNNLAIEAYLQDQLPPALALMAEALALDESYAPHWSNAGVLYLHNGDQAGAERAYARALSLDPRNASALLNVIDLARRTGDHAREQAFRERLARVQQHDPLQQFIRGLDYERLGDYPSAIEHYRHAIQLHHDEHRFYSALARVYLLSGDTRRAGKALQRASTYSNGATRAAYQAQLQDLQKNLQTP